MEITKSLKWLVLEGQNCLGFPLQECPGSLDKQSLQWCVCVWYLGGEISFFSFCHWSKGLLNQYELASILLQVPQALHYQLLLLGWTFASTSSRTWYHLGPDKRYWVLQGDDLSNWICKEFARLKVILCWDTVFQSRSTINICIQQWLFLPCFETKNFVIETFKNKMSKKQTLSKSD